MSVLASAGVVASTIHALDFKDTEGDRQVGRKTLPILYPTAARPSLMFILMIWSAELSALWGLGITASIAFNALALILGTRFVTLTSVESDQRSSYMYTVSIQASESHKRWLKNRIV